RPCHDRAGPRRAARRTPGQRRDVKLGYRVEDGDRLGSLLWEFGPGWRMISSAMLGGGIGPRTWVLNAQVVAGYSRMDAVVQQTEFGRRGDGDGMMSAGSDDPYTSAVDGGAGSEASVGLRIRTCAAAPEGAADPELAPLAGTVNIVAILPVAMTDAA